MRVQKRNPWLYSLGAVLAAMALWGSRAGADVTSDRPGSIVIWPKVISDGTRDTLITLTNTSNATAFVHCVYVNAIGICRQSLGYCSLPSNTAVSTAPACPGGDADICDLGWNEQDFGVVLTRQQPTIWRVSTGRIENPLIEADGECDNIGLTQSCPGLFMSFNEGAPGQVLPQGPIFRGELKCIQVTSDGGAVGGNALKGEATIETIGKVIDGVPTAVQSTQISKYNSINVRAAADPPAIPDSILPLNGVNPANVGYNVYNACPEAVEFTNYSPGADDLVAADIDPASCEVSGCPVTTEITVIPCRENFENQFGTQFSLDIEYTNEFEQTLSVERTFECWVNFTLQNLGFANLGGSTFQRTRINPSGTGICIDGNADLINTACRSDADCVDVLPVTSGVCAPASGVLAIVEEFHDTDASASPFTTIVASTDAANAYSVDTADPDLFTGRPGKCRGATEGERTSCTSDAQCGPGRCRNSGATCSNTSLPPTGCGPGDFCDQCMNDEIRFQPETVHMQQP